MGVSTGGGPSVISGPVRLSRPALTESRSLGILGMVRRSRLSLRARSKPAGPENQTKFRRVVVFGSRLFLVVNRKCKIYGKAKATYRRYARCYPRPA